MNHMNVPGMPPGAGGPVGGIPMMNNGSSAPRSDPSNSNINDAMAMQLNTYIYDYFIKRGHYDCARSLVQDESIQLSTVPKGNPNRREGDMNGVDGDAMVTDSKDDVKTKIPDDLPRPNLGDSHSQNSSFLLDWFLLFWDMFWAHRKKSKSADAMQYLQHTQNLLRLRDQQQSHLLRQGQMMPNQFNMRGVRGAMMPANLQKAALQNSTQNMTPQQIAQLHKSQQAQMMQMQREHSDIEMNGHRPQSPSSVENAPSPSKRPRLDGSQVNGQQMTPNGRGQGQGMPGQPNQQTNAMLMQHGINPRTLTPQQFQAFQSQNPAVQAKTLQVYNQNLALHQSRSAMNNQGMPNGLMNPGVMPNQGDMMNPMHDSQGMLPMHDFYAAGQMQQMRPGMQQPNGATGNHALQDYQMQLMLLEQQNKRRLLMARQEQDTITRADGQPPMPGQPNLPPGTSPQGSRAGASPNPNDQMKRGTPKMPQTGLPGSPSVGDPMGQGRGSPASMNFGGQMTPEMSGGAFFNMKPEGIVGPNMRPPSSNPAFSGPQMTQPMDAMARQIPGAGNRMPSGNWQQPQGQPMAPQQPPQQQQPQPPQPQQQHATGQPQPAGTPQERNAMPPPQAPPAAAAANGRTQPSSPQSGAAPPTPQQANKPAPKSKKEAKENARKRPPKKVPAANANNAAATPSSEAEPPPTPTPSTPITPVHPNSFNKGASNATTGPPQPTSAPAPQNLVQQPQETAQPFDLNIPDVFHPPPSENQVSKPVKDDDANSKFQNNYNLDFTALDNPDILENFDFDTFLNTDDSAFQFDASMTYPDGVEAGAGDGL
ncbi:hypothetical protein AJ80_05015 [Polytolypa hystricis UAMH7299]|uniref:LisH domain-containing protein n=1 Tax=Polytolypa hystricis (strain UAMH7299) TaxID=1447883 RepID=A0A2B7Y8K6_POLH7|nr:hypothetical protein AJ80_05015 [Polytolypa hystricis UAMH7299]